MNTESEAKAILKLCDGNLKAALELPRGQSNLFCFSKNSHGVSPIYFVFLKPSTLSSLFPYARD